MFTTREVVQEFFLILLHANKVDILAFIEYIYFSTAFLFAVCSWGDSSGSFLTGVGSVRSSISNTAPWLWQVVKSQHKQPEANLQNQLQFYVNDVILSSVFPDIFVLFVAN